MKRTWSPAAEAKLRELYATTPLPRLCFLLKRSPMAVKSRAARLGLTKGARRPWTEAEDDRMCRLYPDLPTADVAATLGRSLSAVYGRADLLGLHKSEAFHESDRSTRIKRGHQNEAMRGTRFRKGQEPVNKGRPQKEWMPAESRKRCARTQFKKGARAGRAQALYQPIGAERVSKDGYLERKVHDGMPLQSRWRGVHLVRWEEINGPLPPGHALVFRDGNKANTAPENMELVTRAELMRRNSYWNNYPREVAELNQLRGAITRKINRKRKDREEQSQRRA